MNQEIHFLLNGADLRVCLPLGEVVLDFLRRDRRLTGTKEGCREGDCGACMVLLGGERGGRLHYRAMNSCLLPLGEVQGKHLVTIEGLNPASGSEPALNPIQQSIVENGATQCGFCTPGLVVALTGFFLQSATIGFAEAVDAVGGNICRCTGYASIKRAIGELVERFKADGAAREEGRDVARLERLVGWGLLPEYFLSIPARLAELRQEGENGGGPRQRGRGRFGRRRLLVAGGTDLFVQKPQELLAEPLEFLSGRPELSGIWIEQGRLFIGAATVMEDLKGFPQLAKSLPQLSGCLELIGSAPIRQRATVGGNIVNASPIGDLSIILLALGASVRLKGPSGTRELALQEFFRGYKKLALKEKELLEWVAFPLPESDSSFNFEKVSRRKHLDIASVNSAACIRRRDLSILDARLSAGGVAPVPLYLRRTSEFLTGREATFPTLQHALSLAQEEIAPISDVRGSSEYKRLLLKHLLAAHFLRLFPEEAAVEELI